MRKQRKLPLPLFVIVFVLALPVLIPYVIVSDLMMERRRKRLCETFACANCGEILGFESLQRSNEYWREYGRRMRRAFPGARLRTVRSNWAICINCGAAYTYKDQPREFVLTDLKPLPFDDNDDPTGNGTSY